MKPCYLCWSFLVISLHHVWGQEPLPIMELYDFVESQDNIINYSGCKHGLINEVDWFTVRAKVKRHGTKPDPDVDTTLYLYAGTDPSTDRWRFECVPNLSVCGRKGNRYCYCESKDDDGYYNLELTIKARSIYSGGALMMAWWYERKPNDQLVFSNNVDYPGIIWDPKEVILKVGPTIMILDTDPSSDKFRNLELDYTPEMTLVTFCVYNLRPNSFIEIKENEYPRAHTTNDSCVALYFTYHSEDRELTMTFTEYGGCERTGLYILKLKSDSDSGAPGREIYEIALTPIICIMTVFGILF